MSDERPLPALRLADKLDKLQPGEMVLIGRDGRVIGRRAVRRRQLAVYTIFAAACAYTIAMAPLFGVAYTGVLAGYIGFRVSRVRKLNRVARLIRAERLDEAERAIEELERGSWRQRTMAAFCRAQIAVQRGRIDDAIDATDRCARLLERPDRYLTWVYWGNLFLRASLLLERGRLDEAKPVIARALAAPDGELYAVQKRGLEALRAFATDQAGELGTDDELHDRARDALRYNHTGGTVALLAWAYERRGDAEMCAHLVGEVPARCLHGVAMIERAHPRLWAWLGPKLEAQPPPEDD